MTAASPDPPEVRRDLPQPGLAFSLRNLLSMGGGREDMLTPLQQLFDRHGPVVAQGFGGFKMVNLFGPDANRAVLLDRDQIFSSKRPWDLIMGRIFPGGLLLRDGLEHKHHRRIMHSAFKRPALRSYADRMGHMIGERLDAWPHAAGPLLAFPAFKALTLDMAAAIFVGAELGPGTQKMNQAFEDLVAASMSRVRLPLPGLEFNRGLRAREFMQGFFGDLLPKRRAGDGPDMLTRLCHAETEEGHRFSDTEVTDHMIFLMMAAHDTTTSTLTSLAYELARHPEWQERAREECLGLGSGPLDFETAGQLEQLGWILKETLRRYPPLPVIPRICTEPFEFGGFEIPAETMVVVSPIHTHHMPEWWTAPTQWNPARFAPDRAEHERHTHSWIAFGGGPHHCLGIRFAELQVKCVVHQILCRYRLSVPDGYRMPIQQAPISKPLDGLPLTVAPL
ncbi:MAG: cytochrome P450 [Myxococcales bacterium]|nr:cytochrome P450 [Myxococcales bacterium]